MIQINENKYKAEDGYILVRNDDYMIQGKEVYLSTKDCIDNWTEMTEEEASNLMVAIERMINEE